MECDFETRTNPSSCYECVMDALNHILSILDPAGKDLAVQLNAFAMELGLSEMQATAAIAMAPEVLDRDSFIACAIGLAKAATSRLQEQARAAAERSEAVAAIASLWETPVAALKGPGALLFNDPFCEPALAARAIGEVRSGTRNRNAAGQRPC